MSEPPPRVLVAYGSKRGGTREIAEAIAEVLLNERFDVELEPAEDVVSVSQYDAVIIGGALYMNHWQHDAKHFVKRHEAALRQRPVYMFSSGPLDDSATEHTIPPPHGVARLMSSIDARGHITFGGRLEPDARGFAASAMAKQHAGDWRSWHQIRGWAREIARALREEPRRALTLPVARAQPRWLLAALCFFVGLTAIGGGLTLVARPDGSLLMLPPSMLEHSPFSTFLIPGLLLLVFVGFGSIAAGALVIRNSRIANHAAFAAGATLLVWIVTEMGLLRSLHWLHISYFIVAAMMMYAAYRRWHASRWLTQ